MPSLPPVSAKVIADAEQFISEFRKAEHTAHSSGEGIRHEVDHIVDHMTKSARGFSAAGFAHGILAGFGIGSGAMIVEHTIEKIKQAFEFGEKYAEELEKRAESIAKIFEKIHSTTFTEMAEKAIKGGDVEGAVEIMMRHSREISAKMDEEIERKQQALADMAKAGASQNSMETLTAMKGKYHLGMFDTMDDLIGKAGKVADEAQAKWAELLETFKANAKAIEKIEEDATKAEEALTKKDVLESQKRLAEAMREVGKEFEERRHEEIKADELAKHAADSSEKLAEKYAELADVTLRFKKEIAEVNDLMDHNWLSAELGAAAIDKLRSSMLDAELKELFGDLDKMVPKIKAANDFALELGNTFANSFEEAIVSGRKLSDVLRSLAQDVLRLFVHQSITTKLAGYLGATFSGAFEGTSLGASEAPISAGIGGDSAGITSSAGSRGGDNYFTYNFASGVTRQEVAGLLPQLVDASKRAVAEANMRGGAYRRALA